MTATVTPTKLEQMAQAIAADEADLLETIAGLDRLGTDEYHARQEAFARDPLQKVTGDSTVAGRFEATRKRLEGRRNQLVRKLDAARPVLERERQADMERRNAGLIRQADKAVVAAFDGLDARMRELVDWWENTCLDAVEQADRCPAYTPTRPVYASLRAFLDEHAQVAHRPHISRLVDLPGFRAHGAGSYGSSIFGQADAPEGWQPATGFGA
jgi:hypothetical protein